MQISALPALAENAGLAHLGEPEWAPAVISARQVETLRSAQNPSGRPNTDVLRGFLSLASNRFQERWEESGLYQAPFALLGKKIGKAKTGAWWVNPHANPGLRGSLARLDRFLVAPLGAAKLAWTWVDAGWLPDHSLLTIARNDDFVQGILQSRLFVAWWLEGCKTSPPLPVIEAFPFPWPPATPFGSLTGIQQDLRYEVARALRNQDTVQLDAIVTTAYGLPPGLTDAELLTRLLRLHHQRRGATGR
jgi:hypothetical protein